MKYHRPESGTILILSMIIIFALASIGFSLAQTTLVQYSSHKQYVYIENAQNAADAGVSATVSQLNSNSSFAGFTTEQAVYSDSSRGKATYSTTVTQSGDNRIIVSTGRTYKTTDNTQLADTKRVQATAVVKKDKITNSLIFGSGGVYLSAGSGFPSGDIYIRGQLQMEQNASIGSSTQSVNLNIANVGCDTGHNWPQPCGSSSPPIKMLNSTPGSIYGTVCATNQPSPTTGIFAGPTGTGLTANCTPRVSAAPTFDKKAFVQSVSTTGTNPSTYSCPFGTGTITIPPNTRLSGDWTLTAFFGTCTVYITGNLYITGNVTINPGVVFKVADSVGTVKPVIVVNQGVTFFANVGPNDMFLPNTYGTPFFLMIFGSTNNTCSISETTPAPTMQTCLTPDQAKASASLNSTAGTGIITVNATGAIFYGYYGGFSISPNVTIQYYALGTQSAWLGANTKITAIGTDAPFGNVLSYPSYQVADYQQLY